jgi:hypothetical protein
MQKYRLFSMIISMSLLSSSAFANKRQKEVDIDGMFECRILGETEYRETDKMIFKYDDSTGKYQLDIQFDRSAMEWWVEFDPLMTIPKVPKAQYSTQLFKKVFGSIEDGMFGTVHGKQTVGAARVQAIWALLSKAETWDPNIKDCRPKSDETKKGVGLNDDRSSGKDVDSNYDSNEQSSGSGVTGE